VLQLLTASANAMPINRFIQKSPAGLNGVAVCRPTHEANRRKRHGAAD
jgi:hypothetical protein